MNILQLTAHYSPNVGGVETHLSDLVLGLSKRGFNISVLTYNPLTTNAKAKTTERQNNVFILRIPWFRGLFYKLVNKPALEFMYLFPGLFLVSPFVIIARKIDVIHAHGLVAGTVGVIWGKILGKRVVVTTHSIYNFPNSSVYRKFVRWMFGSSSHVLCLSNQSRKEIVDLGIKENKVSVFTYWINQGVFKRNDNAKKILSLVKKPFIVLFVGRLVTEKGIRILLDASKRFDTTISLMLAGVGPLEEEVKAVAKKNNEIIYLGNISQNDLPLYYSAATLLIVPSIHEEGFGRVILEALSCGLPVIASNRGGIKEALNSSIGELIEINAENIAKSVNSLIKNPKRRKALSKNGIAFVKKHYSENNLNTIIQSYGRI